MNNQIVRPEEIETQSMSIITSELGPVDLPAEELVVLKRVIHTTADFDYRHNLTFTHCAAQKGIELFRQGGATVVTDTNMALSGINKTALQTLGCTAVCYMADPDVAVEAKERGVTRATISMERAAKLPGPVIYAIGNAPTALIRLHELVKKGVISPALIVGVPVGFVNVVESKELILGLEIPAIVARGRKGGSNVAAAILNALMYQLVSR